MREAILSVENEVDAPVAVVREWFLSLEEHPERYAFETHDGFEFQEGGFGEPGARFTTREKFFFVKLQLPFELTEVQEAAFSFRLLRPASLDVWGQFEIEEAPRDRSLVALRVGSESRLGQIMLRCYPVAAAVHRQISGELANIRASIEEVSGEA